MSELKKGVSEALGLKENFGIQELQEKYRLAAKREAERMRVADESIRGETQKIAQETMDLEDVNDEQRVRALTLFVKTRNFLADGGNIDTAVAVWRTLPDKEQKNSLFRDIMFECGMRGDTASVYQLLVEEDKDMGYEQDQSEHWAEAALGAAQAHNFALVDTFIQFIDESEGELKDLTLEKIAFLLAGVNPKRATEYAEEISDEETRAKVLLEVQKAPKGSLRSLRPGTIPV